MTRDSPISPSRAAAQQSLAFILDLVRLTGFGRDIFDALLLVVATHANLAAITSSPTLQLAYASVSQPPPEALRRPVSVNAIATSLNLPFETVRRRIAKLAGQGACAVTPAGICTPIAGAESPMFAAGATMIYLRTQTLFFELRRLGSLDAPAPSAGAERPQDAWPARLVMRCVGEFVVRSIEPLTRQGVNILSAFIIMQVLDANTRHLMESRTRNLAGPDGVLLDVHRRPVSITVLASHLGLPRETVRRHVIQLAADGWCRRQGRGWIVPAAALARPPIIEFILGSQLNARRMFATLGKFGVLADWEAQRARDLRSGMILENRPAAAAG
jgi:hypothetical protein